MHVYTCTDTQKTGLFAEQAQFFDPRWTRTSFVASSSNPALCWSWMTLGFCVDGLVSPALGTTGLEDESTKNTTAAVGGCSAQAATAELLTQYFFRNCSRCTGK